MESGTALHLHTHTFRSLNELCFYYLCVPFAAVLCAPMVWRPGDRARLGSVVSCRLALHPRREPRLASSCRQRRVCPALPVAVGRGAWPCSPLPHRGLLVLNRGESELRMGDTLSPSLLPQVLGWARASQVGLKCAVLVIRGAALLTALLPSVLLRDSLTVRLGPV